MTMKNILLIQGHPDTLAPHLGHALAGASVYRWYFRAHSVKSLEHDILGLGIAPVHETLVGMVGDMKPDAAAAWMGKLRRLGREAG